MSTQGSNSSSDNSLIRLSKLMAEKGLCSRREADAFIEKGWVYVDGIKITQLGTKVLPTASVTLSPEAMREQNDLVTIIVNKPVGWVSAQPEPPYKPAVQLITDANQFGDLKKRLKQQHFEGLAVVGRLDIDSQGLLLFTQDGRLAKKIIGENGNIEKEYIVRVEGRLNPGDLDKLRNGSLVLDGKKLKPAKVEWINEDQLRFVLTEGKKRQVRRMSEMVGLRVTGLKRVRIGQLKLSDLPEGKWRFLAPNESI
jgi:23S rRNA pseudouridine2604 synthase